MTTPDTQRPRPGSGILRTALRRNVGAMAGGTVLMGLYQAGETAFPIALGLIVEHTLRDRHLGSLGLSVAALAVIITTVSLSWRFGMRVLQKANTTEAHRWRVRVAACGLQPVGRDLDLKSGEVLTIATEDADQTADIIEVVPLLVSSLVAVLIAAVALGMADIGLGLLVIVGTVGVLSVLSVMSKRIGSGTREQQARVARAGAKVADLIAGLRPLHGFGGNHAAFRSYRLVSTEARNQAITVAKANGAYAGAALALNALLATAVTLMAGRLAFQGQITTGELVMAVGLAQFIMEPLKLFSEMPKYIMVARASAERMALVLAAPPVTTPGTGRPAPDGGLEVDCVQYGTLRELKFQVPAGEFAAIAAYQPRAASDLIALLSGDVPPGAYKGVVRVGGRETADLSIDALREHMLVN
ncbi:MAG: ABC transporter transmembrane domain-containing protein, partial [Pseudonocardia sp.]